MRRLAFRLALAVGRLDVERLLEELTPDQFDEWEAFFRTEGFGALGADERAAKAAWLVARASGASPDLTLDMVRGLFQPEATEEQSEEDMIALAEGLARASRKPERL